ncbi:hypothetical protein BCR41DRAFT_147706 [Lobosporangium transversale]|uniref:Uncharacterized protein n=1 Tax=Lobosporangium transversale TaxID=64571 RepID=A0A1Y2GFS7_9FUNG|nr:hypothetical protein BCR41DRAFT_147706 [Lobosporangium transversale]ORZ08276.1 hypothetical protein BCR41DRAFT_147706 [Lobosporangium transversale]|eukprot:XP_021878359.1 hypothetical protein BCR41DRAFT_147706 [Lobosporangium transversale]
MTENIIDASNFFFYFRYDYNYTTSLSSCQPSRTSTPTFDQDVSLALKKIAAEFFQPDSDHSMFLKEFVSGMYQLPVTESGIKGLPRVGKRGPSKSRTAPTLLFFDLPTEGQPNKNLSIVEQILADNPGLRHLPYTDYQDAAKPERLWDCYLGLGDFTVMPEGRTWAQTICIPSWRHCRTVQILSIRK